MKVLYFMLMYLLLAKAREPKKLEETENKEENWNINSTLKRSYQDNTP